MLFQYNLTNNSYSVLHNFTGAAGDGATPLDSVIAVGSTLYGLTSAGGTANNGTIFLDDTSNKSYAVVHSFAGGANDGDEQRGSLLLHDGKLYGTTFSGGADFSGTIFSYDPATGSEDVVHDFGMTFNDGTHPHGSLISVGGRLYGMTQDGGDYYLQSFNGTVFEFDPLSGSETVLHSFGGPGDGEVAVGSLYFDNGVFYGMTQYGGATDSGIIFSLDLPEPSASLMIVVAAGLSSLRRRSRSDRLD